MSFGFYIVEDK